MTRTDNKITPCKIQFNLTSCKNLSRKELDSLSDTATNIFHFIQAFRNKLKLCDFVNISMVEDRVDSSTCGIFQLYFYDNPFNPDENSKIQDKTKFNKKTIETLLNEIFVLDNQDKNEQTIKKIWTKHRHNYMMDVFYRERQLCELFKSENNGFDINFTLIQAKYQFSYVILETKKVKKEKNI